MLTALLAAAACRSEQECEPRADHTVVACLDGAPVTAAEVADHLRVAATAERALDQALRVRVFAAEARRRGLTGRGEAGLHQALIRDEAAAQGATPERVTADEARQYYEAHPGEFNKITETYAQVIFVDDPARAEAVRREVEAADAAAFAAAGGVDIGEAHGDGVDPALRTVANDLRAEGAIGGPVQLADGRWAIIRASAVRMEVKPLDALMLRTVQNRIAHDREQVALDALDAKLRAAHRIRIFEAELALVPAPAPP